MEYSLKDKGLLVMSDIIGLYDYMSVYRANCNSLALKAIQIVIANCNTDENL